MFNEDDSKERARTRMKDMILIEIRNLGIVTPLVSAGRNKIPSG